MHPVFQFLLPLIPFAALTGCDATGRSPQSPAPTAALTAADSHPPAELVPGPDGKVRLTPEEWRARLTPEKYHVLREAGTECAFTGSYWKSEAKSGVFRCAGCGLVLFDASDKFDSGTGWPSFTRPIALGRIIERTDNSHGMRRVENVCARCDSHLGHVFPEDSTATGLRYCLNSAALVFTPDQSAEKGAPAKAQP